MCAVVLRTSRADCLHERLDSAFPRLTDSCRSLNCVSRFVNCRSSWRKLSNRSVDFFLARREPEAADPEAAHVTSNTIAICMRTLILDVVAPTKPGKS